MYTEKRNFARLALNARASIKQDDRVIEGEVENFSMKGVFVAVTGPMEMDYPVAVTIYNAVTPQALCDLKARRWSGSRTRGWGCSLKSLSLIETSLKSPSGNRGRGIATK